ncbi:MAG: HPr-rel-A system PqqD family peptide chaperone [Pacificimonas sp.]
MPDVVRVEPLDDLTLAFHRLSGETHILSKETEALYAAVSTSGATVDQIIDQLIKRFGSIESESGVKPTIAARLDELVSLGLLSRED